MAPFWTRDQHDALAAVDREIDNIRTALRWALQAAPDWALRLVGHLGEYWFIRHDPDALGWLDAAVQAAGSRAPLPDRALAQLKRSYLLALRQQRTAWAEAAQAALELYRRAQDHAGISASLNSLAGNAMAMNDIEGMRASADAACRHARMVGDDGLLGKALAKLALPLPSDERPAMVEQAAALLSQAGDDWGLAAAYIDAAHFALAEDRLTEARSHLDAALPAAERVDTPEPRVFILGHLGLANLLSGDLPGAREALTRQLRLCDRYAFRSADEGLVGLAAVCAAEGRPAQAARLLGAVRAMGYPAADDQDIADRLEHDYFAHARTRYGPAAWHRAEQAGAELSSQQAIAYAINESSPTPSTQAQDAME